MKIKLEPFEIPIDDPFKYDVLNRKESAEILTQFVNGLDQPYVIAVDSQWGSGKTTFLRMWQAYLKNLNNPSIYFNAWENDHSDEILIPLINCLDEFVIKSDLSQQQKRKVNKYLIAAKMLGVNLVKRGIPAAIKIASHGVIDASDTTEKAISEALSQAVEDEFSLYKKSKDSLEKFRNNLEALADEIRKDDVPLILIIDELDRCRPSYAVRALEVIKHVFSSRNVVFVLGLDKEQLGYSIETLYGEKINKMGYLSRFIDLEYHLPAPNRDSFIDSLLSRYDLESFFNSRREYPSLQHDRENVKTTLVKLADQFKIELRAIEQIISQMVVVVKLTPQNVYLHPILLCFLLVLRRFFPENYLKAREGRLSDQDIDTMLVAGSRPSRYLKAWLKAYVAVSNSFINTSEQLGRRYQEIIDDVNSTKEEKEDAKLVLDHIHIIDHYQNFIEVLCNKIEIATRFE